MQANNAITRMEVLVIVACVTLLCLTVIAMSDAMAKNKPGVCASRLKELGLGLYNFAQDHGDKLPWQAQLLASNNMPVANVVLSSYYRAMSDYLLPWRLVCPQDKRKSAKSWQEWDNLNVSYFLDLSARWKEGNSVLSGDRYMATNSVMLRGFLEITPQTSVQWTKNYHNYSGNLLIGDGSVSFSSTNATEQFFIKNNHLIQRLVIP